MREWYTYDNELRAYNGTAEEINVPTVINGHCLTVINDYSFSPEKKGLKPEVWKSRSKIQRVKIEEGYKYIGKSAFEGCESLEAIDLPKTIIDIYDKAFSRTGVVEVCIPKSCRNGVEAFSECKKLKRVVVEEGVEQIGDSMFAWCDNLNEIQLPNTLIDIPPDLFRGCEKLKSIYLPESIEKIGGNSFEKCDLEKIIIPTRVKKIESAAFKNCKSLKKIQFAGNSLISVGQWAFENCDSLEEVVFPEGLRWTFGEMFVGCRNLKRVVFPKEVYDIYLDSFLGAETLKEIVILGKATNIIWKISEYEYLQSATIRAPRGSKAERFALERGLTFCVLKDESIIQHIPKESVEKSDSQKGIKAKEILLQWLDNKYKSKSLETIWKNYNIAVCDEELIDGFVRCLKQEQSKDVWNVIALGFTEILLKTEKTDKVQTAFEYIRDVLMKRGSDNEMLKRIAKSCQYDIDFDIGSTSIGNQAYMRLFINLAKYFC